MNIILNISEKNIYSPNDKSPILIKETKRLNLDFLCLSETRLLGSDNLEFDDYVLVWSGKVTEHQSGLAILMKKKFTTYKLTIEPISAPNIQSRFHSYCNIRPYKPS